MSFSDFYAAYPRKRAPADAEKAYRQQIAKGATHQQIKVALDECRREFSTDAKFIPYPATWLRSGEWMRFPDVLGLVDERTSRIARIAGQRHVADLIAQAERESPTTEITFADGFVVSFDEIITYAKKRDGAA